LQGSAILIDYNSNERKHPACQWITGTFAYHNFDIKLLLMNCTMLMSIPPPDL